VLTALLPALNGCCCLFPPLLLLLPPQVSQAFGSVTNLGGVALHQGLLDYTAQVSWASHILLLGRG
jgi:hypothetical protein